MSSSNEIKITDNSGTLVEIIYVPKSAVVPLGQNFSEPPNINRSGRVFKITFLCDRENSSSVASEFNKSSGGAAHEYAAKGGGGTPDELNFYFTIQMRFSVAQGDALVTLNLGQGHYSLNNNWWLGGKIVTSSPPGLDIPLTNSANLSLPMSGDTDSYTLSQGAINGS